MKPNEENSSSREIHQEIHTEGTNGHVSTTRTTSTVPSTTAAHHKGYVQGEIAENHRRNEVQKVRDNDNAARGLLLGIILASLVGLVLGTIYYLNRRDEAPIPAPLVIPVPRANQPSTPPAPTRTIEREKTIIEKIVPAPQPSPVQKATPAPQPSGAQKVAPAPQQPAPNINITVPNSQRQDPPAPQAAPAPSSPSNNINITVPNPQREPAPASPSPAPQSSTAPSSNQNDSGSGVGTGSESNTESGTDSNPSNTATPGSNSGADGSQQ
ncbi:hypothetical protein PN499_05870 [Kamptonema animale CS-326]|jgi:hypothetical protein|uniref:hypothetical protein n=1 Tax=Kamptonema animale TaxID=92934 RepID=UPI00232F5E23|nr:hypothetical protein [Kamptonema animale]MDB9510704.1 hypothetical protein [Kamptonema animale CS-326]